MTGRAIPAIVLVPFLAVAIVVSASACGTMVNFGGGRGLNGPSDHQYPLPYGGVVLDVKWGIEKPSAIPVIFCDLVLSTIGDTLTIPFVPVWYIRELIYSDASESKPAATMSPSEK